MIYWKASEILSLKNDILDIPSEIDFKTFEGNKKNIRELVAKFFTTNTNGLWESFRIFLLKNGILDTSSEIDSKVIIRIRRTFVN